MLLFFTKMLSYKVTVNLPTEGRSDLRVDFRYYAGWGNGSVDGWQERLVLPTVTSDRGESLKVYPLTGYAEFGEDYKSSQRGLGFDQHAQYYQMTGPWEGINSITISGEYPKAAYYSITVYRSPTSKKIVNDELVSFLDERCLIPNNFKVQTAPILVAAIIDYELSSTSGSNPFVSGNPSIVSLA